MGWEQYGKHKYYYRSIRKLRRVVKEYVGRDRNAWMQAAIDDVRRKERRATQAAWQKEQDRLEGLDAGVGQLHEFADLMARLALIQAGYHQHNHGEWRKRLVKPPKKRRRTKRGPRRKPGPKKGSLRR